MSFAITVNLVLIILCAAVLVQCFRVMRSLEAFRAADLPGTAAALDSATGEARRVLADIRRLLAEEAGPKVSALAEAKGVADELAMMVGIANATADRLLEAARTADKPPRRRSERKAA